MTTPTNRQELKRAIGGAYDDYLAKLDAELKALGHDGLHGVAAAHSVLGDVADKAYRVFREQQRAIQDAYGRYVDAPSLVKQARAARDQVIHNARSRIVSTEFNYDQMNDHASAIKRGDFAKYGITELSESELSRLRELRTELRKRRIHLATVTEAADDNLAAKLARLEEIRPGVTTGVAVQEVAVSREASVRAVFTDYDGPFRWIDGLPRRRAIAKLSGVRDVTMREIRLWWTN